jgi:hydroxylamine reductase (hybrid-cluster protein)
MARHGCSTHRVTQLPLSIEVQVFLYEEKAAIIALFGMDYTGVSKTLTKVCTPSLLEPAWKTKRRRREG